MWCDAQSKQNVRAQNTGPYRGRQNSKIDFFFVIYCLVFMFLKKLLFRNNKKVKKWYERKLLKFTCSQKTLDGIQYFFMFVISQLSYTWHSKNYLPIYVPM